MADEKHDETLDAAERTDEIGSIEVEDGDRTEENASPEPEMEDLPALVLGDEAEHDAELHEEVIDSEIAWRGKIFDVERLQVRLPNGHTSVRDVVRHRGAAAVVALTTSGKIALVRQYRTSLGRVTVEIPAGKLDSGEDPLECAKRELKEETGFVAGRIAYLTTIATSCGFADELIHIYLATQLSFEGARPDDDEFLNVDLVPVGELVDAVLDGKIEDAKTVVGALACEVMSRRLADAAVAEEAGE
ncbi:MAG TPA: NUDIX hydrolase [Candidatus Coprousia avicola]|nr:NUDIX hydrolase [Candidatus Coprousia avicola]